MKEYKGEVYYIVGNVDLVKLRKYTWNQNVLPLAVSDRGVVTIRIKIIEDSTIGGFREVMALAPTVREEKSIKVEEVKWSGGLILEDLERTFNIAAFADSPLPIMTFREVFDAPIHPHPASINLSKKKETGQIRFSFSSNDQLVMMGKFGAVPPNHNQQIAYVVNHITRSDYIKQTLYTQVIDGTFNVRHWNITTDELFLGSDSHLSQILTELDYSPKLLVHYPVYSSVYLKPKNWMKPL